MFLFAVNKLDNIRTIAHKYLVCGHTQNEGDNAHSLIEKAVKRHKNVMPVYTPVQYGDIIRQAKKNPPYFEVIEMTHDKFHDLKKLQIQMGQHFDKSTDGEKILTAEIRECLYKKETPLKFFVKKTLGAEDWISIYVGKFVKTRKDDHNAVNTDNSKLSALQLVQAYTNKLPLPPAKERDIRELIRAKQIPHTHALYYDNLFKN